MLIFGVQSLQFAVGLEAASLSQKKKKRRRRMLFNGQSLQEALSMLGRLAVTCLELCDD